MPRRGSVSSKSGAEGLLTIGALSSATGIPIETLRTWERRYGFPVPERKPSGHRVYRLEIVPRLRRAAQAIARGHRAAEVIPASERALEALLDSLPDLQLTGAEEPAGLSKEDGQAEDLLDAVRRFDAERLRRLIHGGWARRGPIEFLERTAAPFLAAVGTSWAQGELEVRHEHFATGVLGDFLRTVRAPLEDRAQGPVAVLATPPGELHGVGLQMAALVFSLAGWRALILGVDTPIRQIAALAREAKVGAVALSCVQQGNRTYLTGARALRRLLLRRIPLLLGGRGAPSHRIAGVEVMASLVELERWIQGSVT
jgi:MerR family transcriptional regulator, light-induced transcriptional regulator